MFNNFFPPRKSYSLWDNVEEYCTARQALDDNITRHMRITCWVTKATNTHSEYDFLLPQLYERASILRYTHKACFVIHQYVQIHVVSSHRINIISLYLNDRQTRLLNVLGQIAMILGDKKILCTSSYLRYRFVTLRWRWLMNQLIVLHILAFAGSKFSFPSNCIIFWTSVGV